MPTVSGRVPFDELPPPVRKAILALQTSLHHHTAYHATQITFTELRPPNEFVKPIIDVRPYDAPLPASTTTTTSPESSE